MAILIPRMVKRTKKQALATHRNHTKMTLRGAISAIDRVGYTWDLKKLSDRISQEIRDLECCVEVQYIDMKTASEKWPKD